MGGEEGILQWERFGDLCLLHPHLLFGKNNNSPKLGGPVCDVWTLWERLPRPPGWKGELWALLRATEKRAAIPRTHPLLQAGLRGPGHSEGRSGEAFSVLEHGGPKRLQYFVLKAQVSLVLGKAREKI